MPSQSNNINNDSSNFLTKKIRNDFNELKSYLGISIDSKPKSQSINNTKQFKEPSKSFFKTNTNNSFVLNAPGNTSFRASPKDIVIIDADSFDFIGGHKAYTSYKHIRGSDGTNRLLGADAPETSVYDKYKAKNAQDRAEAKQTHDKRLRDSNQEYKKSAYLSQDFGNEATIATEKFIQSAKYLNINLTTKDTYNRTLVEIRNDENVSLSDYLVKEGLAMTELPTSKYFDGSQESFARYKSMIEAYKEKKGIFSKDDFINPTDFRKSNFKEFKKRLDIEIKADEFKFLGSGNNEYNHILADEDTYFTLSASLGASAHYGNALESNLMEQEGWTNLAKSGGHKGLAQSIMEYNNQMLDDKPLSAFESFVAKAYDSGLNAGGIGNWLNREVFMPRGWGRVYKDEKGALPSIAGLAGRILDESYLYYANMSPDWAMLGQNYRDSEGYVTEEKTGMFQTMFESTASFALAAAQSLGMYIAITQPIEMLTAEASKHFLDRNLQNAILNNTPTGADITQSLNKARGFGDIFSSQFYFGDMAYQATKPGGLLGAVLEQKMYMDTVDNPTAFFNHEEGVGTAFKAQLLISRGRAERIMQDTFRPFLMDVVNPFDATAIGTHIIKDPLSPTGTRVINSYDKFNIAVNKLIKTIAIPIGLNVNVKQGMSVQFRGIEVTTTDLKDDISLAEAKAHKGGVVILKSEKIHPITNYTQLSTKFNSYNSAINSQISRTDTELFDLLIQGGMSDRDAKLAMVLGKQPTNLSNLSDSNALRVEVLVERRKQLMAAKSQLGDQFSSYADKMEVSTTNTGAKYKTNIAAALQDILEMTPLNPLKWGLFNGSAQYSDEFIKVGQVFSFREAAEYTERILTGETQLTAVFKQFETVVPDADGEGIKLTREQRAANSMQARMTTFDDITGYIWKQIKSVFKPGPSDNPDITKLTDNFRKVEVSVFKAAEKAKVEGFRYQEIVDSVDAARSSSDIVVANIDEAGDLLDTVLDYSHEIRNSGGVSLEHMSKAINSAGLTDVTGNIMRNTKGFSGNIKIEDIIGGTKGYIAAAVFMSIALNNIMQSTKGTSILTQLAMGLVGEDEDIAIKYEANRFAPTEVIATALGISQTGVNFAADAVAISSTYAVGYALAKRLKTSGYSTYTLDIETVKKMAENEHITISMQKNGVMQQVDKSLIGKMTPGHDSYLQISKTVYNSDGSTVIKQTILTRTAHGFKTEKIAQEFAENVPTKAFVFGAIALLATNALRQSAATMLSAMTESPDDKNYLFIAGGLTLGGFAIGSFLDGTHRPLALQQSSEIAKVGGQVASKRMFSNLVTTKAGRWAVGGAIAGATIWAAKLALDPNITQKGSLDPLIGGVALGLGVGIFKKSASLGIAAGLVAMSAMAALNWAGIRVFELGRSGKELDPENAKLVAQLSQFSTAVLEKEKDNLAFSTSVAAYASQFGGMKSLLSKDNSAVGETQVIARQAPLPVLQFFVAEKIEGRRGEVWGRNTADSEYTVRKYTVGIQTGALLGTSLSVELPVSYTPGQGFFGFSYNEDNNLMSVPNFVTKVGVWAGLATSMLGIGYNLGGWMSNQAYNLTGMNMFKVQGQNFANAADDLFSASKFIMNAAEKISAFFIRTTVGIFTTLQGTDASMAYDLYKNSTTRVTEAEQLLSDTNVSDLSKLTSTDTAKFNNLDDVSNAKDVLTSIKEGEILRYASRSKHMFIGALLGGVVGGTISDVVKHFRMKSTLDADMGVEALEKVEAQEERRKMIYLAVGGSIGALGNDLRSSVGLIKTTYKHHSTAVTEFAKNKNLPTQKIQEGVDRLKSKFGAGSTASKFKSVVLNNRIVKFVAATSAKLGRNKFVGIFIAATAFNFIRTDSNFGIATMMDRHVLYDENGKSWENYEDKTAANLSHHVGISLALGAYYTGIMGLAAGAQLNQKDTLLQFAQRELKALEPVKTVGVLNKIKTGAKDALFSVYRYSAAKESEVLIKSLLSIDNEFVEYENFLEKRLENTNLTLPKHLQKIEDVLKLRKALGKDEIKEFIKLRNQKQAGVPFDFEEETTYKKFLTNIDTNLSQADNFGKLAKGFKVTSNLTSFSKRVAAFVAISYGLKFAITTVGNQGGEVGVDSYLDQIYNASNRVGKIGQRRQDGSIVGLEGVISIGADLLRIITGRDTVNLHIATDELNGKLVKATGQRLVGTAKNMQEINRNVKDLSEMLVVDNPNAYIATLSFGGKTLRDGDKGITTSSYFQLQSAGQDISTATYSMASKFIFNQYAAGKGRLGKIIDNGLATYKKGDQDSENLAAVNIRNATSMMEASKTHRSYSKDVSAHLAGDSAAAAILAARQERLAHIAWQPPDSLYTQTFFSTLDKAKNRTGGGQNFMKFLRSLARSESDVLATFANLMEGGVFENFFARTSIANVIFFTGSSKKPAKKTNSQVMATEISDLWQQTQDLNVQAEMFKQSRIEILDNFMDRVVIPLSNSGVLALVPDWMKIGGVAAVTLGLSAVMALAIAQYTEDKSFYQSTTELLEVFGKETKQVGPKIEIIENNTKKIVKELEKHIAEGQKYNWSENPLQSYDNGLTIAKGYMGDVGTQSKFVGLINVGADGKPLHIRFELNPYLDILNSDDMNKIVETLGKKGEILQNLFRYTKETLDENGKVISRKTTTVGKELLEADNIRNWFNNNSTGKTFDSVYEIFNTASSAITKTEFIGAAVTNFQENFQHGLDKLFDLNDVENLNSGLFQTVTVNGQEVLAAELLDPDFKIPGLTEGEFGPAASTIENIQGRKAILANKYKAMKAKYLEEVRVIVEEEYAKIGWKGKGHSIADDTAKIAEANRKALTVIKAKMSDPSTAIGAISKGAGIVQATDLVDQTVTIDKSKSGAKKRSNITRNQVNGDPVDTFIDEMGDTLHYSRPLGNVGFWDGLAAGGKGLMNAGFTLFDALTGADILSAYLRVAEIQGNPLATDLDRVMANKELGRTIMVSTVGLITGMLGGKLLKVMGGNAVKSFLTSPSKIAKTVIGLTGAGILIGATWKNIISPVITKISGAAKDSKVLGKLSTAFEGAWFKVSDTVGQVAAAPVIGAYNVGKHFGVEKEAAYFTAGFIGGATTAAFIGIGAGVLGTAITLPVLAAVAAGIGLIVGVAAIFGQKKLTSGMVYASREISKIPMIGGMLNLTDPYRTIRNQERFQHHFVDSPFLLGYVGDIINNNWMQMLAAAENPGGRDTVSLLFGEILGQGEQSNSISAWKLNAVDSMIGSPKPIIDEVISNELRIRAERYSDFTIGRYTWDELVQNSDNSNMIRAQESANRAERMRIVQQARTRSLKAAMQGGGPTAALKTGSSRKSAVTQQQAAAIEAVYKDLDKYGKPQVQVTAASMTVHKSNAKNEALKHGDQVKSMALGNTMAPLTKNHIYKGTVVVAKGKANINIAKLQDPMNPLLTKQAQAMGANKTQPIDKQLQMASYNAYKDQA
jgi:endonuclease YncB( thermonuclease family)